MKTPLGCILLLLLAANAPLSARSQAYDLTAVHDIAAFTGSAEARTLLEKNGFVVADPAFKQIFEPYIKSPGTEKPSQKNPWGNSLPSFITTDSAWHTYHVLLEEAVKDLEESQSRRLAEFSRLLLAETQKAPDANPRLVLFAAVGLALQDTNARPALSPEARRIVDALLTGTSPVPVPIGFDLSPLQFRAQSFYTQSPELTAYFAARQWYASVAFRLADARETRSALTLATLIQNRPELIALWKQLSAPYDDLLAPAEDGSVPQYAADAETIFPDARQSLTDAQISRIQKILKKQLPAPQVNDQWLSPGQFAGFSEETRGFRLLPSRRLPCAVCFQNTVDPKIPGRLYPSGLDFVAASPVLRSPAAVRALQNQFGEDTARLILQTDCGPLPDSLHGDAMRLLATLQQPLPASAPAALRTEAWSDLTLWTQLAAWAEQRHTWALHAKPDMGVHGIISPPNGTVAPYPDFFLGLAALTRRTADTLDKAGLNAPFEIKPAAAALQKAFVESQLLGDSAQLSDFASRNYEKYGPDPDGNRRRQLEAMARRCAAEGTTNPADIETLKTFYDCRENLVGKIRDFAPVCDRLALLAKKSLNREPLTDDDALWIRKYGVTLAGFHFYGGNSYEVPQDNFPIVTRIFSQSPDESVLYAGLARPQSLYVIAPDGDHLQLYRGAVMSYREFVRPAGQLLDDDSWRELVNQGRTPPAPPFTSSFYAEKTVRELLAQLRALSKNEDASYADYEDILWQIGSRVTDRDLPVLFETFQQVPGDRDNITIDGLGDFIAKLSWQPWQNQLVVMVSSPDSFSSKTAARILVSRPDAVNVARLVADYPHQPPRARRLYCAILSRLPHPGAAAHELLLAALKDSDDGVRWQAACSLARTGQDDPPTEAALLGKLNDANDYVAAAAVRTLAKLGATNTADRLSARLKTCRQAPAIPAESRDRQLFSIINESRGYDSHPDTLLDDADPGLNLIDALAEVLRDWKFPPAQPTPTRPAQ